MTTGDKLDEKGMELLRYIQNALTYPLLFVFITSVGLVLKGTNDGDWVYAALGIPCFIACWQIIRVRMQIRDYIENRRRMVR